MKDGRAGSRSATTRQALPDWESDDRAGKQSSSAIHDDIDRRVQALLTALVPAGLRQPRDAGRLGLPAGPEGRPGERRPVHRHAATRRG
jgi:hypothetical protein